MYTAFIGVLIHVVLEVALIARVMTRPHRNPASRIAWVAVIAALPVLGMLSYVLLGETNIGRRRIAHMKEVIRGMPGIASVLWVANCNFARKKQTNDRSCAR